MPATTPPSGRRRPTPGIVLVLGVFVLLGIGLGLVGLGARVSDDRDQVAVETASPASTTTGTETSTTDPEPAAPAAPTTTASTTTAPTTTVAPTTSAPGRTGVFAPVPGQSAVVGTGPRKTYSVEVEEAVNLDRAAVGADVEAALSDPRSWIASGEVSFQRIETGGDLRIVLATPATVDELCLPLDTAGVFSCRRNNQLNLNSDRWSSGADRWPLDIDAYRNHVINHEVGHALGYTHVSCPGPGQLAPVMMQQTKGLDRCVANEWPYPEAGADTEAVR